MAASICMMRNLCKLNGVNLLKNGNIKLRTPISTATFTTFVARTPKTLGEFSSRSLVLLKNVKRPCGRRQLTLTTPTKKAAVAECKPECKPDDVGPSSSAGGAPTGGGGTFLWTFEKILSATLLVTVPAAFMYPSQALDALLAISLVMHSHWGIEAVLVDYARPNVIGHIVPKLAHIVLYVLSITTLGGLFYLIHNDIGIAESIKRLWQVKGKGATGANGGSGDGYSGGFHFGGNSDSNSAKSNDVAKADVRNGGDNAGDKKEDAE